MVTLSYERSYWKNTGKYKAEKSSKEVLLRNVYFSILFLLKTTTHTQSIIQNIFWWLEGLSFLLIYFWLRQPGNSGPVQWKQSLHQWTTREVPELLKWSRYLVMDIFILLAIKKKKGLKTTSWYEPTYVSYVFRCAFLDKYRTPINSGYIQKEDVELYHGFSFFIVLFCAISGS